MGKRKSDFITAISIFCYYRKVFLKQVYWFFYCKKNIFLFQKKKIIFKKWMVWDTRCKIGDFDNFRNLERRLSWRHLLRVCQVYMISVTEFHHLGSLSESTSTFFLFVFFQGPNYPQIFIQWFFLPFYFSLKNWIWFLMYRNL